MPMETDRAATLADAALVGRTDGRVGAAHPGDEDGEREGSSLRVLVVGAETGKLAAALVAAGASHILVIDHSQVRIALHVSGVMVGILQLLPPITNNPLRPTIDF